MVQIQINVSEEISKQVNIYAAENDLPNKADAVNDILEKKFSGEKK